MNTPNAIEEQISADGENLYFFFGGIAAGIAMPPFEFFNASKILNDSKIFFRDFAQSWYQNGLPGLGDDAYAISNYIQKRIEEIKPQKVFFVGNSMGGYAAILFAILARQGEAIAFAPQTFISPDLRLRHNDRRWAAQIQQTHQTSALKNTVWDLKEMLSTVQGNQKISIYVSKDDSLDHVHALHIEEFPCVHVYEFDSGGHGIVKLLRDTGKLPEIMAGTYS